MFKRFYEIEIGAKFKLVAGGTTKTIYTKNSKSTANYGAMGYRDMNSQALVTLVEESIDLDDLDVHTFDFTDAQLAEVIRQIIDRVARDYSDRKINLDRLRKGLYAAHQAKPIRLIDLLHSCFADFPADVIKGVYRHYDPKTNSIKNGWTAQHSEPYQCFWC